MLYLFTFAPVRRAALAVAWIAPAAIPAACDADTALALRTATNRRAAFRDLRANYSQG